MQISPNTATSPMSFQQPPIHRLVLEVLQEIFVRCLPSESSKPDTTQAPLLLCRICSSWRNIAINMLELWQSLTISPSFRLLTKRPFLISSKLQALAVCHASVVCHHYISLVKGWFDRTKESLLSLQFWFDMPYEWRSDAQQPEGPAVLLISEILVGSVFGT